MKIVGESRPLTDKEYSYSLFSATKKIVVKEWQIEYNGRLLKTNPSGVFRFAVSLANTVVKLKAVVIENGITVFYSMDVSILAGKPKILSVEWRDYQDKPIGKRKVGYLDQIKLAVKTQNIPAGDTLKVTVFEDDNFRDREAGTHTTSGVDKSGYAYLFFDNIKLYRTKLNNMDMRNESDHEFYIRVNYKNHIEETWEDTQLHIQNELKNYIDKPPAGNRPVVVGKVESVVKKKKKSVNFTFGIFLDGTLNNMYNTEIRKEAEGKKQSQMTPVLAGVDAKESYKDHGDPKDMESSYENDLSNPAILFKNYTADFKSVFKVYTEGIGTNTSPAEQGKALTKDDYKKDDVMQGPAFGIGSAGIKDKVRKAITDAEKYIAKNITPETDMVGTITFDVFGFSRGAAAARYFVHVITQDAYKPSVTYSKAGVYVKDKFGYSISDSYAAKTMPAFGYLGQLLTEAGCMDEKTKVVVRFVGIYDTVPHHGLFQWNDIKDLSLDEVNKADYVVHITAGDEHRANFSLVDISSVVKTSPDSGKKGGIELAFPGVHCDVGGAYEEGRPDNPKRIDATVFDSSLDSLRTELIKQGWFHEEELIIVKDSFFRPTINNFRLEGKRAKISNQYSYIPLHVMVDFCKKKTVPIDKGQLINLYKFTNNWISGNTAFLENIKQRLNDYSFNGGKPFTFIEAETYVEPPIVYASNSPNAQQYAYAREQRQLEGQARMNAEAEKKNEFIKFLRNHYLHWNSSYGQGALDTVVQKNKPNIEGGKRKRAVR
ncbi:hypothetical protein M2347_003608 [Chryseobacterium sp. H1D6B]|uniref:T6SS phospholipase effector Tle1-like catalytic domain-containing protein n=1 Tax=Chryseobacterium sp. H1D6B TaxID=2940588 RepID=UPI0015C96154|nr:DUF2235 domain-containing protein [Chryseobacterium sp. H1D6B]MDH6253881.1 hypothetical protein [Chryseobacterium sp. H1D6B]